MKKQCVCTFVHNVVFTWKLAFEKILKGNYFKE